MPIMPKLPSRKEAMRIAGKLVSTDDVIEVKNPYDGSLVGTVPMARPEHVREAFQKAKDFKPKLSRYERQQILQKNRAIAARSPRGIRAAHLGGIRPVLEGCDLRIHPRL